MAHKQGTEKKQPAVPSQRMRRKQPPDALLGRVEEDVKKGYSAAQLAEIGAITLTWNQIEFDLNQVVWVAITVPTSIWLETVTRFSGIEAKRQIVDIRISRTSAPENERKVALESLSYLGELKRFRDSIVHSIPFDTDKSIGRRIGSSADIHQIILTQDALEGVYARMEIAIKELRALKEWLFAYTYSETTFRPTDGIDPPGPRHKRRAQEAVDQLLEHQRRRKALPQLPMFPDAAQPRTETGQSESRPRPD